MVEIGGEVGAFLLAFREGADYDSPNFRWFAARYDAFLYIDRIVVGQAHRGKGVGIGLYEDLFAFATQTRFGFREVGTQWVAAGRKQVSLQDVTVSPHGARA